MRFAIDVMGGDHAPDAIVKGCIEALPLLSADDQLILVGDRAVIHDIIAERNVRDERLVIEHAPDVIGMDESPVEAVRTKPDSSLVRMTVLGSAKKTDRPVDVVLSAGNTGACVSAATMFMRRLPGAHRPGIACTLPSLGGPVVLCDVGANPEPRPSHLAQYGLMAEIYARRIHGKESPRVAVMNIGSEEAKGTGLIKETRDILRRIPDINYIGYIEGRELFEGTADVVVTDGFVGNTMLKLAEGLASSIFKTLFHEVLAADPDLAMRLEPVLKGLFKKNDYHEYGGAPLLGVNGVCVICHGSSEARTIRNAIRNAREYVQAGVNQAIVERLSKLDGVFGAVERSEAA
ncbi:MAG: phosphate acyltransferase PlsX [Planctomycetota bacterium]|nr:phosphate acyltransferase PlsX [Planctomycetota bacterium]